MSSVTRRIKINMRELETGRRGKPRKGEARKSKRIDRRVARADARLKAREERT